MSARAFSVSLCLCGPGRPRTARRDMATIEIAGVDGPYDVTMAPFRRPRRTSRSIARKPTPAGDEHRNPDPAPTQHNAVTVDVARVFHRLTVGAGPPGINGKRPLS